MRNERAKKLLQAVGKAVLLGFVSGAAKAIGLLLFTYLLQRQLGKGLGRVPGPLFFALCCTRYTKYKVYKVYKTVQTYILV